MLILAIPYFIFPQKSLFLKTLKNILIIKNGTIAYQWNLSSIGHKNIFKCFCTISIGQGMWWQCNVKKPEKER